MNKSNYKKIIALLITVLILTTSTILPVFADNYKGISKNYNNKKSMKHLFKYNYKYMLNAYHNKISKLEAIIMIIDRINGEDNANTLDTVRKIKFKNNYLDLAVEKNIITEDESKSLKLYSPLKRYELAMLLVRLLNKEDLANEHSNEILHFKDSNSIPSKSIGYIYLAQQLNLIESEKAVFQPNKPIKRAEFSKALQLCMKLKNEEDKSDDDTLQISITGIISSVNLDSNSIDILEENNITTKHQMPDNISVIINDENSNLSNLKLNMKVSIIKNNDVITTLLAEDVITEIRGIFVSVVENDSQNIIVKINNTYNAYEIKPDTVILSDNEIIPLNSIEANSKLLLRYINNNLMEIIIN